MSKMQKGVVAATSVYIGVWLIVTTSLGGLALLDMAMRALGWRK